MISSTLNLRIACSSLRDAWKRNLLALVGLAVGVAAVVTMLALTLIVRNEALRQFDRTGIDVLAIRKVSTEGGGARRAAVIDLDRVRDLGKALPSLEILAPVMQRRGKLNFSGRASQAVVLGASEEFFELNALELVEGRGLSALDRFKPHAVVGRELAASLRGGKKSVLGQPVTVEGRVLTIIGVLATAQPIKLHAGDVNQSLIMDATTFTRVFEQAEIEVVYARHIDGARTPDVVDEIAAYLQTGEDGLRVEITSAAQLVAEMERQLRLFTLLLGATGSIALVLGGAGIMNSLLLAVAERRREIGLRRTLGALRGDIQAQFLYESVMLCGLGGLLGIAFGTGLTGVIAAQAHWVFFLPPALLVTGLGIALMVGAAVGFFPAYQAARLDPVVAMKADR